MPDFFDSEERSALETDLRNRFASRSGMGTERFDKCLDAVLFCIGLYGFNKGEVKKAVAASDDWKVPESFVELVWDTIRTKAQKLAEFSFWQGVITTGVLVLFFLAIFSQHLGIEDLVFINQDAPEWIRSKWAVVIAGICFLCSIAHVVRGWLALSDIRKSRTYDNS